MNRALNCIVRPSAFDFVAEQQVEPVNGYGIIPLLAAAGSLVGGAIQGKAKSKQAKYEQKAAEQEAARQRMLEQAAARKRQALIIAGIAGAVALILVVMAKRKKR